jgi:hypothetical protein
MVLAGEFPDCNREVCFTGGNPHAFEVGTENREITGFLSILRRGENWQNPKTEIWLQDFVG